MLPCPWLNHLPRASSEQTHAHKSTNREGYIPSNEAVSQTLLNQVDVRVNNCKIVQGQSLDTIHIGSDCRLFTSGVMICDDDCWLRRHQGTRE